MERDSCDRDMSRGEIHSVSGFDVWGSANRWRGIGYWLAGQGWPRMTGLVLSGVVEGTLHMEAGLKHQYTMLICPGKLTDEGLMRRRNSYRI